MEPATFLVSETTLQLTEPPGQAIVYKLARMENPAAGAPDTQSVPVLPPVAGRWTVAPAQPTQDLCWDLDF